MVYALTYKPVQRLPNPMVSINPLKRGTGRIVSLQDRVDQLNKSAVWKKVVREWRSINKNLDSLRLPRISMERLGSLWIDEDIQRPMDELHCAKIADPSIYDPALMQCVQCIKTTSGIFISIDTQHTAAAFAALIDAGLMTGTTDWREIEFPFQYIETDNLAFARKAFGILNGKGKKRQSAYMQLRTSVFCIRIDGNRSDSYDVEVENKVKIAENNHCYPIEEKSRLSQHPGTFANIATFLTLNDNEVEIACKWHNTYFHYEPLHVSLFFIFKDICRSFKNFKVTITPKLLEDLAALVQDRFGDLQQYQESVTEAHRKWSTQRYGQADNWKDHAYACALLQLYVKLGGTEHIPAILLDQFDGIVDFFDDEITTVGG